LPLCKTVLVIIVCALAHPFVPVTKIHFRIVFIQTRVALGKRRADAGKRRCEESNCKNDSYTNVPLVFSLFGSFSLSGEFSSSKLDYCDQTTARSVLVLSSVNFDFSSTDLAASRSLSHATCS